VDAGAWPQPSEPPRCTSASTCTVCTGIARCSEDRDFDRCGRTPSTALTIAVSSDEEYVHVQLTIGSQSFDLAARTHNYLLLILARRRLSDAARGVPDEACGWVDSDEFSHDPSLTRSRINLDVHRIRRQLSALALGDPVEIVERRPRTKLRIGIGNLSIIRT
jgi:hypothetical protein